MGLVVGQRVEVILNKKFGDTQSLYGKLVSYDENSFLVLDDLTRSGMKFYIPSYNINYIIGFSDGY